MLENSNLWIVLWVKERCSQFPSIEVTLNKMSLFYFILRDDQIKHQKMWQDFQSCFLTPRLEFLLFQTARNRILPSMSLGKKSIRSRLGFNSSFSIIWRSYNHFRQLFRPNGKKVLVRMAVWDLVASPALLKLCHFLESYLIHRFWEGSSYLAFLENSFMMSKLLFRGSRFEQ